MNVRGHGILKNTFTVGSLTALSRVLGLVREMLQSRLIGAGIEQSAFTLAFAIPNMARKLFGEGALTAAFVPVFRGEVERDGIERAAKLARAVMTMAAAALAAICALVAGGLGVWARIAETGPRAALTVSLVQTLLPYMMFICAAAFGTGVLNALGRFKAPGFVPVLLNIVWISTLAALLLFPSMTPAERVKAVAWAILAAGALQMAFVFVCMAKAGVSPRPALAGWREPDTLLVWRNMAVAAFGAGAVQANYALDQLLAQLASGWAAGVVGYAERLMDLPLGVVGVAFGTVMLPTLSGLFAKRDGAGVRDAMKSAAESMLFLMIPAAAGLAVLARETTAVIYEGGGFDAVATVRVSRALAVYAAGIPFFGLQKLMIPWYQAQGDMKTPLRVSVETVLLNATLNIAAVALLPVEWRHVGLAASTTVCSAAGCVLLSVRAGRYGGFGLRPALRPACTMAAAACAMAAAISVVRPLVAGWNGVTALAALVALGAAVYGALAFAMLRGRIPRRIGRRR